MVYTWRMGTTFEWDSFEEERFLLLGENHKGQLLVVSHTDRQDGIRIISVRKAERRERREYEQG